MTLKEITMLVSAGFTKDEIMRLSAEAEPEKTTTSKAEGTSTTVEVQPTSTGSNTQIVESRNETQSGSTFDNNALFDKLIARIDSINETIKQANIINSRQPEEASFDDFLANIINPKKEGDK